jgi:hypothetical protein
MHRDDFEAFAALLDDVAALLQPGQPMNGTARALYFRTLAPFSLEQVRFALEAHLADPQRGRFMPKPADVIAQLQGAAEDDGRPGADEAWAGALNAADEDATVVWTAEMAQAWFAAKPVFELGDKVGARMAFRDAYERLVGEARKARRPVAWETSLGHDKRQRDAAIREAVHLGRLPNTELQQLPSPAAAQVPLLELVGGSDCASPAEREARAKLLALREQLVAQREEPGPGADALAKAETRRRQAEIAAQIRAARG